MHTILTLLNMHLAQRRGVCPKDSRIQKESATARFICSRGVIFPGIIHSTPPSKLEVTLRCSEEDARPQMAPFSILGVQPKLIQRSSDMFVCPWDEIIVEGHMCLGLTAQLLQCVDGGRGEALEAHDISLIGQATTSSLDTRPISGMT